MNNRLIHISESEGAIFGRVVTDGKPPTDRELLQSMAGRAETTMDQKITTWTALNAIVAQAALDLKIENGARLVQPTSALLKRNMRFENPVEPGSPIEDDTLFYLSKNLLERPELAIKFRLAVALGDAGLHYAAGIGGKHLKRMADPSYSRRMAGIGYSSALGMADARPDHPAARSVKATVPELAMRPEEVIAILRSLMKSDIERRIALN